MNRSLRWVFASAALIALLGSAFAARLLNSTGEAVDKAAATWLASLNKDQRYIANLAYADPSRTDWHFIPKPTRKGLQIKEMNDAQRAAAKTLLQAALSESGYRKSQRIMAMEGILRELEAKKTAGAVRDPERYYFTLFGKPGTSERWAISVEGHHFSVNFVIEGGKVISSTPTFFGANPATNVSAVPGFLEKGERVLSQEEDLAFTLLKSLSAEQSAKAIVSKMAPADLRDAGKPTPPPGSDEGLSAAEMTGDQRKTLDELIAVYANNVPADLAAERLAKIDKAGREKLRFVWAGADKPGVGHYYRIEGPTFQIELCNNQADAEGNQANHIHSMWRDTVGDFALEPSGK